MMTVDWNDGRSKFLVDGVPIVSGWTQGDFTIIIKDLDASVHSISVEQYG